MSRFQWPIDSEDGFYSSIYWYWKFVTVWRLYRSPFAQSVPVYSFWKHSTVPPPIIYLNMWWEWLSSRITQWHIIASCQLGRMGEKRERHRVGEKKSERESERKREGTGKRERERGLVAKTVTASPSDRWCGEHVSSLCQLLISISWPQAVTLPLSALTNHITEWTGATDGHKYIKSHQKAVVLKGFRALLGLVALSLPAFRRRLKMFVPTSILNINNVFLCLYHRFWSSVPKRRWTRDQV